MTAADFIGIPWRALGRGMDGADCWGLVRMAARELYDLHLPEYFYSAADLLPQAATLIDRETCAGAGGMRWQRCEGPRFDAGTVHIFRIKGHVTHCALHMGGEDFLHSLDGQPSALESLSDIQWSRRRAGSFVWQTN